MHRALALSLIVGALLMLAAAGRPGAARVSLQGINHTRKLAAFGKILIVDITFRNDNLFSLQDVIVSCHINGDPARP